MQLIVRCLIVTVFPPIRHNSERKCKVTNILPKSGEIESFFNRHSPKIWPNFGQGISNYLNAQSFINCRPASVNTYFCFDEFGLSGIVGVASLESKRIFKHIRLNLVRLVWLRMSISSMIDISSWSARNAPTTSSKSAPLTWDTTWDTTWDNFCLSCSFLSGSTWDKSTAHPHQIVFHQ